MLKTVFTCCGVVKLGEHGLKEFEIRVLRRIFRLKKDYVAAGCRNLHMRSFIISALCQILFG
jgi:hypothetical protein